MGVRGTSEASVPLLSASSDFDAMRLEDPFIAIHLYVSFYYFIHILQFMPIHSLRS